MTTVDNNTYDCDYDNLTFKNFYKIYKFFLKLQKYIAIYYKTCYT